MKNQRLKLHSKLCEMLGSTNVYFQPPPTVKMKYPAIVYNRGNIRFIRANNGKYLKTTEYTVTVIDKDPDSEIVEKFIDSDKFYFSRQYTSDNLNHNTFTINI